MTLKCIAVDDEPLALSLVCKFIEQTPFLQLVGRYSSAVEALKVIHAQQVDLIYLDIQMPDLNGIELARFVSKGPGSPRIVFTTAFAQFGIEGYKVDALDYLLKPFSYEEFLRTAQKALAYRTATSSEGKGEGQFLFLKVEYQWVRIALDDILYIEGLKDYVKVHLKSDKRGLMSLIGLGELEGKLPSRMFMRVHRSYIVALDKITSMTRNSLQVGDLNVVVGGQYKEAFSRFLDKWTGQ